MENSKKHNGNLGVNGKGKNIRRNYFQRTIDFGNNIITSGRHHYPQPKVHYIDKEYFKSFVQHITGKNFTGEPPAQFTRLQRNRPPPLSIGRPPVPVQVPIAPSQAPNHPLPGPLKPIIGPSVVDNSCTNIAESSISAFMRNFQNSTMNFDSSRRNQFQPYPTQSQVLNNVNVQSQSIIQSQPQHYPMNGSNQLVNGFHLSQINGINQHVNGFPSSVPFNATNPTLSGNASNPLMNDFPSSQTNDPQSPTFEFLLSSPTSNMYLLSPRYSDNTLLSPSLFSSPPSLEYPFYPHLQNGISSFGPPSPLSAGIFPSFASLKRSDAQ